MSQLAQWACPSPVRDESGLRCTSRQRNIHSIESREVRYPWHPWHDRVVAIHQSFTRNGRALFRCSIEENLEVRLLEIPQWMFDPATCCRMRLAAVPTVSCKALLDLKSLLQGTLLPESDVVLEAEHRCLLLQEVLMRRSLNRQRVAQLKLFHPRHQSPAWQGLPREIRLNHNVGYPV